MQALLNGAQVYPRLCQLFRKADERKRILLDHIYGVDIDPQAVKVTKLCLLLKVLEGESEQTLAHQLAFWQERALPDLGRNIKCGNSLIGPDFYTMKCAGNMYNRILQGGWTVLWQNGTQGYLYYWSMPTPPWYAATELVGGVWPYHRVNADLIDNGTKVKRLQTQVVWDRIR